MAAGEGLRAVSRLVGMDRKTVRRYVEAAEELGLDRAGDEGQLTDFLVGRVVEKVRPYRIDGRGGSRRLLDVHRDQIEKWLDTDGLTVVKVHELLGRRGVVVPERTLYRYALEELGVGRSARGSTVRVADGEPGDELQVDFGKLGGVPDPGTGKRRDCWALVFTPVVSRFSFVWLTHRQTLADVIAGFEAAWVFFGGVFATVIPDNMKTIVNGADPLEPLMADPLLAQSAIDRLQSAAHELVLDGESYRRRQKPTLTDALDDPPTPRRSSRRRT